MMSLTGKLVMVVEDESMASMLMEEMLEILGYEVVAVAARLEEAQRLAQIVTIDIATLDVNLAGQMSYPVAVILRSRDIPFIFATGYRSLALPPELRGAVVLTKPYNCAQLADALARSLSAKPASEDVRRHRQ
jgi:CheY-like chemotaxis protein